MKELQYQVQGAKSFEELKRALLEIAKGVDKISDSNTEQNTENAFDYKQEERIDEQEERIDKIMKEIKKMKDDR